jgi:hypothetical protein
MASQRHWEGLGIGRCVVAGFFVGILTSRASLADDILDGDKAQTQEPIIDNGFYVSSAVIYKVPFGTMQGFLSPALAYQVQAGVQRQSMILGDFASIANHDGHYEYQFRRECSGKPGAEAPPIQGDSRISQMGSFVGFGLNLVGVELGAEARAGLVSIPLLMDETEYQEEVVLNTWGGSEPSYEGMRLN